MIADIYPVVWTGQQAVVVFPEHVDMSNSAELRGQLLSVINRGATAVIADLSATMSCDHSGTDALARVYQRAAVSGTSLQLVVASPVVRRALTIAGTDRLVSVYPLMEAALAARSPTEARALVAVSGAAAPEAPPGPDVGTEVALLDAGGVIVSVNGAWREFAAANGGDPARTGEGMSYLEVCAAADDDPVARAVGTGIRQALAGELPGPLTVQVPCHSPDTWRWFDLLISARAEARPAATGGSGHAVAGPIAAPVRRTESGGTAESGRGHGPVRRHRPPPER